jgi:hypothetical protein
VLLVDVVIVCDVVPVVPIGRLVERLEPHAGDAEALKIVQPPHQTFEVADTIAVRVLVLLDVEAIHDGVLVPEVVDGHRSCTSPASAVGPCSKRCSATSAVKGGGRSQADLYIGR